MPEKPSQGNEWTEHDSQVFLEVAELVVPSRQEQQRILCDLIPADAEEEFAVAELGAGDGRLALGVPTRFPRCRYWACERSTLLRTEIAKVLDRFRDRVEIHDFELADQTWRWRLPSNLRCVLVSLAVHHLPAAQKRTLFKDIAARLVPRGALLLADLVEPTSPQARALFARQ